MKKTTQSALARPLAEAIFARVVGVELEYMALAPHILAPRHVLLPSILGNQLVTPLRNRSSGLSSAEALGRMGGRFPGYMAEIQSTLRWVS